MQNVSLAGGVPGILVGKNIYLVLGLITLVLLTRGYWAMIDTTDLPVVALYRWRTMNHANGRVYALATAAGKTRRSVTLHRLIMAVRDPKVDVDHADGVG
jgi:hypothetical protein